MRINRIPRPLTLLVIAIFAVSFGFSSGRAVEPYGPANAEFTIVVTDPLALPLACDCVKGYAQRKYEKLADYLHAKTKKTYRVVWGDSLEVCKRDYGLGRKTILIGKDSVLRSDSKSLKLEIVPFAQLTDDNGSVNQHGLFVVRQNDSASSLLDLEGYRVLWGPDSCDEKSAAPRGKLKELEIGTSDAEICESCSIAARKLVEDSNPKRVAVISSYAERLLEGCGTIKKGDLRIIGSSDEVPFVSAFYAGEFTSEDRRVILDSLVATKESKELLISLETKSGFVPYKSLKSK